MQESKRVNRCVCHRRTFEELKEYAEHNDIDTAAELVENRLCGCGCGMCVPYVKLMLQTGQSTFKPADIYQYERPL